MAARFVRSYTGYALVDSLRNFLAWADILSKNKSYLELSEIPKANDASIKKHQRFGKLFDETSIPDHIEGFEFKNPEEVHKLFPEGTDAAKQVSRHFFP